jgi:hypothetical protein
MEALQLVDDKTPMEPKRVLAAQNLLPLSIKIQQETREYGKPSPWSVPLFKKIKPTH